MVDTATTACTPSDRRRRLGRVRARLHAQCNPGRELRMRAQSPTARKWWTLATASVATFLLLLGITVVNTALPAIEEDLGASFTELQWVVDAYTLRSPRWCSRPGRWPTASGRRRVFAVGLVVFCAASLLAGLAPDPAFLAVCRTHHRPPDRQNARERSASAMIATPRRIEGSLTGP
jgi:hypothetical protein